MCVAAAREALAAAGICGQQEHEKNLVKMNKAESVQSLLHNRLPETSRRVFGANFFAYGVRWAGDTGLILEHAWHLVSEGVNRPLEQAQSIVLPKITSNWQRPGIGRDGQANRSRRACAWRWSRRQQRSLKAWSSLYNDEQTRGRKRSSRDSNLSYL